MVLVLDMVLNETKVVTRPAELAQQSLWYDMGLFFCEKKLVGYGYDFCLFYVIPELETLDMSSVGTTIRPT